MAAFRIASIYFHTLGSFVYSRTEEEFCQVQVCHHPFLFQSGTFLDEANLIFTREKVRRASEQLLHDAREVATISHDQHQNDAETFDWSYSCILLQLQEFHCTHRDNMTAVVLLIVVVWMLLWIRAVNDPSRSPVGSSNDGMVVPTLQPSQLCTP